MTEPLKVNGVSRWVWGEDQCLGWWGEGSGIVDQFTVEMSTIKQGNVRIGNEEFVIEGWEVLKDMEDRERPS
jgi:hypothetical protein